MSTASSWGPAALMSKPSRCSASPCSAARAARGEGDGAEGGLGHFGAVRKPGTDGAHVALVSERGCASGQRRRPSRLIQRGLPQAQVADQQGRIHQQPQAEQRAERRRDLKRQPHAPAFS